MSATATAPDAKVDTVAQIEELKKLGASTNEAVSHLKSLAEKLQQPTGLNANTSEGVDAFSYWEAEDEPINILPALDRKGRMKSIINRLPREYKAGSTWKSLGEQLRDGYVHAREDRRGEYMTKLNSHCKAIQGMSTVVAGDGGAMILPEFNMTLMEKVYQNDLWNRTDRYTVGGNNMTFLANAETSRANGSRHGGLRGYWLAEGGTATASKPTTRRFSLRLKKLCVVVYLTNELLEDAGPVLEQLVTRKVGEEFNFMMGDAVFNGTGAGQPLGIGNSGPLLSITKETGQAAATILAENIDKMWARRYVGGNYAWYHNQDCGPQLDQLQQALGTAGLALYRPENGLAGAVPQMLKGAPRVETEFNATLGTTMDLLLADLGQYVTISKGGIAQAVSAHVEFLTDQTALRFTMRVDGQPWEASAITPYKGSNTQSSFLTIETRS